LDSAISDLQYGLSVEWDQKDAAVQKKILGEFAANVTQLNKEGVTSDQIFSALSEKAFDAQTSKDLANLAAYAKAKRLNDAQTHKLILEYANKSQKFGASWSSEATIAVVVILVLAIVLVACAKGNCSVQATYTDNCYYDDWNNYVCY
jgi:hypothetical protein